MVLDWHVARYQSTLTIYNLQNPIVVYLLFILKTRHKFSIIHNKLLKNNVHYKQGAAQSLEVTLAKSKCRMT